MFKFPGTRTDGLEDFYSGHAVAPGRGFQEKSCVLLATKLRGFLRGTGVFQALRAENSVSDNNWIRQIIGKPLIPKD